MNEKVINNYVRLKLSLLYFPILLLIAIFLFLYSQHALDTNSYIQIQKGCFLFLNSKLSQFPGLQSNLTQLGDVLVLFPLLSIFAIYAPRLWDSLIAASLISAICSVLLKQVFAVPRPAAAFDNHSFVIIGKALVGHNSLPSGHSITTFTTLTVLLYAFMPEKLKARILWCSAILVAGLIIVSTRIGVGAHYPLDVITGSVIGYISGLLGIFINRKYGAWTWFNNKKCYPVFIMLLLVGCFLLVNKIISNNLAIFYLSLTSLVISLYIIANAQVKR